MFNCFGDLWRVGSDYRQTVFAAIQVIGCALVIAIATAANPSTGQAPAVDDGASGANPASPTKGASLQQFSQADLRRILGKEVRSAVQPSSLCRAAADARSKAPWVAPY